MATSIFRAETKNLDELAKRFGKSRTAFTKVAREEMNQYGRIVVQSIQKFAPRKEGNFASGFTYKVEKTQENTMRMLTTWTPRDRPKDLIYWLRFGTGIHGKYKRVIRPKGKKPFPIPVPGGTAYRWSHRGMEGRDFIQAAFDDLPERRSLAQRIGALTVKTLLKRMGR